MKERNKGWEEARIEWKGGREGRRKGRKEGRKEAMEGRRAKQIKDRQDGVGVKKEGKEGQASRHAGSEASK